MIRLRKKKRKVLKGPGEAQWIRILYTEDRELFVVGPDGSRWEVTEPGVVFQARSQGAFTVDTEVVTLIEGGLEDVE